MGGGFGSIGVVAAFGVTIAGAGYTIATEGTDGLSTVLGGFAGAATGGYVGAKISQRINSNSQENRQLGTQKKNNTSLKTDQKPTPDYDNGIQMWERGELGPEFKGKFDANGNHFKVPDIGDKKFTILGAKEDLGTFTENPFKYNVLDPKKNFTWKQNKSFINQAIKNGDHFLIMRNPESWNSYTTNVYGQNSRLITEIQMLRENGVDASRIHAMY